MTYGPVNPSAEPDRSRNSDVRRGNIDAYRSWSELWFIGYLVIFGLLAIMYTINHIFGWGGMILNTFIFMVYAMILAPVLTAPSLAGVITIAGLFGPGVPQAFKTYLGSIAPNIAFWSLLVVGSMAWFPWHLGAWWAGPLVAGISLFLAVHTWKYLSEAKVVKTLSMWYAVGVLLVGLAFALGLDKPIENLYSKANPPAAFNATGTAWQMNPVTGAVFKTEPQTGCQQQGNCFDPDHGNASGGTQLVPFNAALEQRLTSVPPTSRGVNNRPSPSSTVQPSDTRVHLYACGSGWSDAVPVEDGYNISPGYDIDLLGIQYLSLANGWVDDHPGSDKFVSIRFCASSDRIEGRSMGVRFLPKV